MVSRGGCKDGNLLCNPHLFIITSCATYCKNIHWRCSALWGPDSIKEGLSVRLCVLCYRPNFNFHPQTAGLTGLNLKGVRGSSHIPARWDVVRNLTFVWIILIFKIRDAHLTKWTTFSISRDICATVIRIGIRYICHGGQNTDKRKGVHCELNGDVCYCVRKDCC